MELKDRIAAIIQEKNLKQRELASIIGVSESYISALLSGRNKKVSLSVASLIEEKLDYSVNWLLTGEGEKLKLGKSDHDCSDARSRLIREIETLPLRDVNAILAFLHTMQALNQKTDE